MRIYTDHNGLAVNAISTLQDGTVVEGHVYHLIYGSEIVEFGFQMGAVKENGINGITNEAMIATLIHRLRYLNAKFPCAENERAMVGLDYALRALEERTAKRIERGVEGLEVA